MPLLTERTLNPEVRRAYEVLELIQSAFPAGVSEIEARTRGLLRGRKGYYAARRQLLGQIHDNGGVLTAEEIQACLVHIKLAPDTPVSAYVERVPLDAKMSPSHRAHVFYGGHGEPHGEGHRHVGLLLKKDGSFERILFTSL